MPRFLPCFSSSLCSCAMSLYVKWCLLWSVWWEVVGVWGVFRGSVGYEQWLNPLRLDERAQSQSTGCLSSHWGWGGQERIEMHVNTVCVCVCKLHISASKGSAGGCTSEVSLYRSLSLFSLLPSSDESLFYTKTPFQQPDSSFTESTYPQFLSSIPRFLCFSVCLSPALLYSQPIESEVSWQVRMSFSGRTTLFLELILCAETCRLLNVKPVK